MKRREFLATTVSAALLGRGAPVPSPRAKIRFGYAAITWGGKDQQAIDDIADLGFRGIQLRGSSVTTWGERPAELKKLLAERRLEFVALSSGNLVLDPEAESDALERHTRHARFVRDAGGRYLQIIDERSPGHQPVPDDYRRMGRLLSDLGSRTADLGVPLVYHNHMGALGESPDAVARILDAADPRVVHFLLDTAHYRQAGGDPAQAIRRHAGRIRLLHLKDLARDRFVELGSGTIDFRSVFNALDEIGYDGWGVVELDSVSNTERTPKEAGRVARHYLETMNRWNDAS
jgi:inosose dehydratase